MGKILLLCLVAAAAGSAQEAKTPAKKKSSGAPPSLAPKPAPEMQELSSMIGAWTTEEQHEPNPWMPSGGKGSGTATFRRGPGGLSVILDVRGGTPQMPFTAHGVLTWDADAKVYKTSFADSMTAGIMVSTGRKQGNDVVYNGEGMMAGKKVMFKDVISDRTPTTFTLTSYMNDGSGEKKMMTVKHTKKQ
ncbi:MAG: DUF1579 family protein [Bryobacteraceae bacterium]